MAETLRLLLVEDSEDDAALVLRELRRGGFDLLYRRVQTEQDMTAALEEEDWDIIIADYTMPQFSGLAALQVYRTFSLDFPFILVSGTVTEEVTVAAMKSGIHDYMLKDNLKRLVPAIRRELKEATIRQERRQAEIDLREADRRAIKQYEQLLERLSRLAQDFGASPTLPDTCRTLHRFVQASVSCNGLVISLYDDRRQLLTCIYSTKDGQEDDVSRLSPQPLDDSPQSQAIQEGEIIVTRTGEGTTPAHSSIAVPMSVTGRIIGVFETLHIEQDEFSQEQGTALSMAANLAAVAIENARLLQQTQEQALQVQRIINTVPEGVFLLSTDYRILLTNPRAEKHLMLLAEVGTGDQLTHLGGRPVDEVLNLDSDDAPWLWREITTPEPERIFEAAVQPLITADEIEGWVIVLRDITEEHQVQEHLQTQDRLATVGQLAAGIAHDFNNVMAVITLYSSTLNKYPNHPKRESYLDTISKQAQHAASLIGQILDFSRSSVIERSRMDLLPQIKETVKLLQRTLPENILIELTADKVEYSVEADPTRLQQVLMNLAVNARDAMPDGGKLKIALSRLTVKPKERPPLPGLKTGRWVCLAVSDTGTGIPEEALSHIFEPFFTTKQRGKGTGLGLAQVYGIIKQHDGEVNVTSQTNEGTTFTVYLPYMGQSNEEEETTSMQQSLSPSSGERQTILLVEDNQMTRDAIQQTLELLGYQILATGSGQEAIKLFEDDPETVDLVISDMIMPEMGGIEFYKTLKSRHPNVKVMVATGYPLADNGQELLESGIVGWIQKPFSTSTLAHKLREVLDN
ncbi:MAG: response regulator [Candidatus Promineifilaceae bacterium]